MEYEARNMANPIMNAPRRLAAFSLKSRRLWRLGTGSAFHHRLTSKRDPPKDQTTAPPDHRIKARQRQPHRKQSESRATFASSQPKAKRQAAIAQPVSQSAIQSLSQLVSESGVQFKPS